MNAAAAGDTIASAHRRVQPDDAEPFDRRLLPVPVPPPGAARFGWFAFLQRYSTPRLIFLCALGLAAGGVAGAILGTLHIKVFKVFEDGSALEEPALIVGDLEPPAETAAEPSTDSALAPAAEPVPAPRTGQERVEIEPVPPSRQAEATDPAEEPVETAREEAPAATAREIRPGPAVAPVLEEARAEDAETEPAAGPPPPPPDRSGGGAVPEEQPAGPPAPPPAPAKPVQALHGPPPAKPVPPHHGLLPGPPAPRAEVMPAATPPQDDGPQTWSEAYTLAHRLQADDRFDEAMTMYARAAALEPGRAVTFYEWGYALQRSGRREDAIEKYRRALELNPNHAYAHYNLGYVLQQEGDLEAAVESYRRAVVLDARNPFIFYNWGEILARQGDTAGAIDLYQRASDLAPHGQPGSDARARLAELRNATGG